MVKDTALWLILAAMIGWVACGCYVTRQAPARQSFDHGHRDSADR
jgi:hypothetical protein